MCGLAGALLTEPLDPATFRERLARMAAMQRHRGPDHEGIWTDGPLGFAHNRLSIIDLSSAAHQPMADASGRHTVMCNGEIYNFRELRRELEALGHVFRTRSDTEVIAEGFARWSLDLFPRLRGMFAIAVWDGQARTLVLARDRIGKKPMHYAQTRNALLFASEQKAIFSWPGMPRDVDAAALHLFLAFQYVPEPGTAFAGVERLPPAHLAVAEAGRPPRLQRYAAWPKPAGGEAPARAEQELAARIEDAVKMRLVADVPVGALLSGGVDSSAVTAAMARHAGGPLHTFSAGFDDPAFDERAHARLVASHLGTTHHEIVVRPEDVRHLPKLAWHCGDPYGDPSILATYLVAQAAKSEVGVVLTGDGGDELFLGYESYDRHAAGAWMRAIPRALRSLGAVAGGWIPPGVDDVRILRVARRLARRFDPRGAVRHLDLMGAFRPVDRVRGYGERLSAFRADEPAARWQHFFDEAPDDVSGAGWCDLNTYLPHNLLVKMDLATLAHGLEARSPLLDQDLVSWAVALPADLRRAGGRPKGLLRDAFAGRLPASILARRKQGFGLPLESWLRGPWFDPLADALTSRRARERGLFQPSYVDLLLEQHRRGAMGHHPRLWSLWMLELWFRIWVDAAAQEPLTI